MAICEWLMSEVVTVVCVSCETQCVPCRVCEGEREGGRERGKDGERRKGRRERGKEGEKVERREGQKQGEEK